MIRKLLAAAAALTLCTAASAAGKPRTVAIVTPYMANETTKYVIGKLKEDCEQKGWKVNVTDTAGDFGLLVECPLSRDEYEAKLIATGVVSAT